MFRKAFRLQLIGSQEEYKKRHSPVWPDLAAMLKSHGVSNYSIFLHSQDGGLFGYAEVQSEELWAQIGQQNITSKWCISMEHLVLMDQKGQPVGVDLEEVFHLD
jgi:L-rhamnose mutarotase